MCGGRKSCLVEYYHPYLTYHTDKTLRSSASLESSSLESSPRSLPFALPFGLPPLFLPTYAPVARSSCFWCFAAAPTRPSPAAEDTSPERRRFAARHGQQTEDHTTSHSPSIPWRRRNARGASSGPARPRVGRMQGQHKCHTAVHFKKSTRKCLHLDLKTRGSTCNKGMIPLLKIT